MSQCVFTTSQQSIAMFFNRRLSGYLQEGLCISEQEPSCLVVIALHCGQGLYIWRRLLVTGYMTR